MFLSYRVRRYGNLDTLNSKIRPLQQILEIDWEKSEEEEQEQQEQDPSIIEKDYWDWTSPIRPRYIAPIYSGEINVYKLIKPDIQS